MPCVTHAIRLPGWGKKQGVNNILQTLRDSPPDEAGLESGAWLTPCCEQPRFHLSETSTASKRFALRLDYSYRHAV
jgi:hypothetical protein